MEKTAVLYVRLSQEDEKNKVSESIQNQIGFLTEYIQKKGWRKGEIYCDDGFSGLGFERPAFQKMIEDVEKGKIHCIVTKDLSRLGRDYITTGYLVEKYFPIKGVQFVAVNDGIDTMAEEEQWLAFRAVLNDLYAKDISKKIRTSFDVKRKNGKFIGAFAPYGYQKDSKDKNQLVIEKETAQVVKNIFEWYLQGDTMIRIAKKLNDMSIPSPGVYKKLHSGYKNANMKYGLWTQQTIQNILSNETYAGNLTQGKTKKMNYKIDKSIKIKKQNWIVVKNSHSPIIDVSVFDTVQYMLAKKAISQKQYKKKEHILKGMLYCGDCKSPMTFRKNKKGEFLYICSQYARYGICKRHQVYEKECEQIIENAVLEWFQKLELHKQSQTERERNILLQQKKWSIDDFLKKKIFFMYLLEKIEFFETEQETKMYVYWNFSAP